MTYDPLSNHVAEMSTTTADPVQPQRLEYTYDSNGNILTISDRVDSNKNQTFEYDGLSRLTSAASPSYPTISFTYSKTGNIWTNSRVGSYTYDPNHAHAVKTAGPINYSYDANGNMVDRNGATLVYDFDNRLTSITNGATTSFVYDYQGARVKKTTGPLSTVYIGNLFECTGGSCTKHIFAGSRRIATKTDTETHYYHPDHLGGLNVATKSDGHLAQSVSYYPFGETLSNTGTVDLSHKFTDQENDPESGLYYYGARYYDPVIGRFISPDSIVQAPGDPQTLNRYAYCRNNPIIYTDPTGHFFHIIGMMIAGAALGLFTGGVAAAIFGGDPGMSMISGLISGAIFSGVGAYAQFARLDIVAKAALHGAAGGASGAINSGLTGQDLGFGALTGAVSGAFGSAVGSRLPNNFAWQFAGRTLSGGLMGGAAAEIYGGDFGQGFSQGATMAAIGHLANDMLHPNPYTEYPYDVNEVDAAITQGLTDAGAGFADTVSFNGTAIAREWLGADYLVNTDSWNYSFGKTAGYLTLGATGYKAMGMELTINQGANRFKIISRTLKVGFRLDKAHHGKPDFHHKFWQWWR